MKVWSKKEGRKNEGRKEKIGEDERQRGKTNDGKKEGMKKIKWKEKRNRKITKEN